MLIRTYLLYAPDTRILDLRPTFCLRQRELLPISTRFSVWNLFPKPFGEPEPPGPAILVKVSARICYITQGNPRVNTTFTPGSATPLAPAERLKS